MIRLINPLVYIDQAYRAEIKVEDALREQNELRCTLLAAIHRICEEYLGESTAYFEPITVLVGDVGMTYHEPFGNQRIDVKGISLSSPYDMPRLVSAKADKTFTQYLSEMEDGDDGQEFGNLYPIIDRLPTNMLAKVYSSLHKTVSAKSENTEQ